MRSAVFLICLSLLTAGGCTQRNIVVEIGVNRPGDTPAVPTVEEPPAVTGGPVADVRRLPPPSTVERPEGTPRYLSLGEAIALALEGGTVGVDSPQSPGQSTDSLVGFGGNSVFGSDSIRVLALDPARVGSEIEAALSRFDARWVNRLDFQNTEVPIGSSLDVAQVGQGERIDAIRTQSASVESGIFKPLATGGVAGITFRTDYAFTNLDSPVNPSYRPELRFQFEQPLLQGYGVEINQIRSTHPGSTLASFNGTGPTEGILIVRTRFEQSRAEFARQLNTQLWNVESAYWNLYGEYWNLYSRELGLRQAHEIWRREDGLARAGRSSRANAAQARGQYELFRTQRLAAVGAVLESERRLRMLVGLPREDGTRLIPASVPTVAAYQPDWHGSIEEVLAYRPELQIARSDIKVRQFELIGEKNRLLPDLRLTGNYDVQGLGSRLDGPRPDNALAVLAANKYQSWGVGLRMDIPIGFREANARTRIARLNLARSLEVLKDQENKAASFLAFQYRQILELHARIRTVRAQREAYGEQLEVRSREFLEGRDVPLPFLLDAQRSWSDSLATEYGLIAQYNSALAGYEFAKGTIGRYHNVVVTEGPVPATIQKRAVENEKELAGAVVLRERAAPVPPEAKALRGGDAPSLPALFQGLGCAESGLVR